MKPFPPSYPCFDTQYTAPLTSATAFPFFFSSFCSLASCKVLWRTCNYTPGFLSLALAVVYRVALHTRTLFFFFPLLFLNPLWLRDCAAAPANVHVVYSTTAGSGLQHTTVGNRTHAPQHTHTLWHSGFHCSLLLCSSGLKCSSSFCIDYFHFQSACSFTYSSKYLKHKSAQVLKL